MRGKMEKFRNFPSASSSTSFVVVAAAVAAAEEEAGATIWTKALDEGEYTLDTEGGRGGPEIVVRRLVGDKHTGVQELRRTPTSSSTPPTELLLRGDTHHHMTLILRSKVHGVHPQAAGVDEAILSAEVSSYQ
ncbi:hypothetical protein PAMP_013770 [Pampus punctatissimus]